MTDTHPRDLIQRLADGLDSTLDYTVSSDTRKHLKALAAEARAYLTQPEPEGPTDEEPLELLPEAVRNEFASL